ncbi:MAG TPA: hypothetical protein VGX91_03005 [Candidatus Cybelea sp.]|jgi:hypothetical protein|nr:hypothetical protein [Candidatus Cybelea sp.]
MSSLPRTAPTWAILALALAGCSAGSFQPTQGAQAAAHTIVRRAAGLGPTVRPKLNGTIEGFDIDQNGTDGVLANYNSRSLRVSLETFDQTTGKITKVVRKGSSQGAGYVVDGIVANDIGIVKHDRYQVMDPVSGNEITGEWTPPLSFEIIQIAENQSTPKAVMLGYDLGKSSQPTALVVADVAKRTAKTIALDQAIFSTGAIPVIAQNPVTNQALIGASDGGPPTKPTFGLVDLSSGKITVFTGLGQGDVDGIGIDSKTNTACTTTGVDAGVEFYNLKTLTGFEVQLPNSHGSELHSGAGVAVDSIHHLCIIAQPVPGSNTSESAIWIADESGDFLQEITGFDFWFGVWPAINPTKRTGFVENPRPSYDTLTGFSY